jgi:hypothetical protein
LSSSFSAITSATIRLFQSQRSARGTTTRDDSLARNCQMRFPLEELYDWLASLK